MFVFFFGKKPRRNPFNFEIYLNDHCNLNCKSCFHFAPLAKPDSYYPLDEFERDIKRLCSLFDGKFGWVHLVLRAYIGFAADECWRALFMFFRWRSGKWEGQALIKKEESNQIQAS